MQSSTKTKADDGEEITEHQGNATSKVASEHIGSVKGKEKNEIDMKNGFNRIMNMPVPFQDHELPTVPGMDKAIIRQRTIPKGIMKNFDIKMKSVNLIKIGSKTNENQPSQVNIASCMSNIRSNRKESKAELVQEKVTISTKKAKDAEKIMKPKNCKVGEQSNVLPSMKPISTTNQGKGSNNKHLTNIKHLSDYRPEEQIDTNRFMAKDSLERITRDSIGDEIRLVSLSPPTSEMQPLGMKGLWDHTSSITTAGACKTEFRIPLPMTCAEYSIAQPFMMAEESKRQTGGGEGIRILKNEPYNDGINKGWYTYKLYHIESKFPRIVRAFMPSGSMTVHEEAWNQYPYCKTIYTNPDYMKEDFFLIVESYHLDNEGQTDHYKVKVKDSFKKHEIFFLDISDSKDIPHRSYKKEEDPKLFHSVKTKRGQLHDGWQKTSKPIMTAYKILTYKFNWRPFTNRIENSMMNSVKRVMLIFNRRLFCSIDSWYGLTMSDIRRIEEETMKKLDEQIKEGKASLDTLDE